MENNRGCSPQEKIKAIIRINSLLNHAGVFLDSQQVPRQSAASLSIQTLSDQHPGVFNFDIYRSKNPNHQPYDPYKNTSFIVTSFIQTESEKPLYVAKFGFQQINSYFFRNTVEISELEVLCGFFAAATKS